jgi:hypothetical protein
MKIDKSYTHKARFAAMLSHRDVRTLVATAVAEEIGLTLGMKGVSTTVCENKDGIHVQIVHDFDKPSEGEETSLARPSGVAVEGVRVPTTRSGNVSVGYSIGPFVSVPTNEYEELKKLAALGQRDKVDDFPKSGFTVSIPTSKYETLKAAAAQTADVQKQNNALVLIKGILEEERDDLSHKLDEESCTNEILRKRNRELVLERNRLKQECGFYKVRNPPPAPRFEFSRDGGRTWLDEGEKLDPDFTYMARLRMPE